MTANVLRGVRLQHLLPAESLWNFYSLVDVMVHVLDDEANCEKPNNDNTILRRTLCIQTLLAYHRQYTFPNVGKVDAIATM